MPNWTDHTIVRSMVRGLNFPDDDEIDIMIDMNEQHICAMVREDLVTDITFDAAKHGILRRAATLLTALFLIAENPFNYLNTPEASFSANVLFEEARRSLEVLMEQKTITYLKRL